MIRLIQYLNFRKPRKPRDPTLPKTSRGGKPTKSEKSESVPTRPDKWNLIGMGNSNANFDADSTTFCVPAVVLLTHDQTLRFVTLHTERFGLYCKRSQRYNGFSQSTLSDTDTPVRRRKQRKPRISKLVYLNPRYSEINIFGEGSNYSARRICSKKIKKQFELLSRFLPVYKTQQDFFS